MTKPFSAIEVANVCNGMLEPSVYEAIYREALIAEPPVFVEIGTAHAAVTVCLAMAIRDSGRDGIVYTFDKISGGSRDSFGTVERNLEIIRSNLEYFDVAKLVSMNLGDVAETAFNFPKDLTIGMLVLDADGRIDRDFRLFYDQVVYEGAIVIDDVCNKSRLKKISSGIFKKQYAIDLKHRLSFSLLKLFQSKGIVSQGCFIGPVTWKGARLSSDPFAVSYEESLEVYSDLVFSDAEVLTIPFRKMINKFAYKYFSRETKQKIKARLP